MRRRDPLEGSLLETPPHGIAALGIGRAFQNLALCRSMSVRQNVPAGLDKSVAC